MTNRDRDLDRHREQTQRKDGVRYNRGSRSRSRSRSRDHSSGSNADHTRSRSRSREKLPVKGKHLSGTRNAVQAEKTQSENTSVSWSSKQAHPGPVKTLSKAKLETFSVGIQKKSAYQKQKEAEVAKKKREEEEAAKVYEEFVASFDQPSFSEKNWVQSSSTFTDDPDGKKKSDKSKISEPNKDSKMQQLSNAYVAHLATPTGMSALLQTPDPEDATEKTATARAPKRRNLDAFLEELKKDNADTSKRSRHVDSSPNKALETTNVFVGNMAKAVTEQDLCLEFGIYGPIASVKVMKPLNLEELLRDRKWGFVCFMEHADAAAAIKGLTGKQLLGVTMNIDWGKPIAVPDKPYYVMPEYEVERRKKQKANAEAARQRLAGDRSNDVRVTIPKDPYLLMVIHRSIERVLMFGFHFEMQLMTKTKDDAEFMFLRDTKSPEHIYYKWKLVSLLQGDSTDSWSTEPFVMIEHGPLWVPPSTPFLDESPDFDFDESIDDDSDESDSESSSPVFPKGPLTRAKKFHFEQQLRHITLERSRIAVSMVFCIEHSDASDEILDIIMRSLLVHNTPIFPTKLGRLYLLSDILHNSGASVPNAWRYRSNLQKRLPEVFSHFGTLWKSIESRLKAEQLRKAIMTVLAAWETWMIFTPGITEELRQVFSDPTKHFNLDGFATETTTVDGETKGNNALDHTLNEDAVAAKFVQSRFAPISDVKPANAPAIPSKSTDALGQDGFTVSSFVLSSKTVDHFVHHDGGAHAVKSTNEQNSAQADDDSVEESLDDLDGEPMNLQTHLGFNSSAKEGSTVDDDDEDLDGVPMNTNIYSSYTTAIPSTFESDDMFDP
ncbi:hypothetical protein QVD99_000809 [Batrachochytrium dendrobatidis]|nr:hypothetical protein QVD99_000809 [Batrachochytrium dendrobatidis]